MDSQSIHYWRLRSQRKKRNQAEQQCCLKFRVSRAIYAFITHIIPFITPIIHFSRRLLVAPHVTNSGYCTLVEVKMSGRKRERERERESEK
jgi:hypothetical protein